MHVRRARTVLALSISAGVFAAAVGCESTDEPEPDPTQAPPVTPVELTLGVWGSAEELVAYDEVVKTYNAAHEEASVSLVEHPNHDSLVEDIEAGKVPDVFMVTRNDLAWLYDAELTRPIGGLLDERGVDFGDEYSRAALEAFALDRDLQCMPYGISPMVVYYNPALVDFEAMEARGLDVPSGDENARWTFEEFRVAAEFAARPRRGISGFDVDPTLEGLAPFIYSAGGVMFDDEESPTSLAFSSDDTRSALEDVLPVLRDPQLTLSPEQLTDASAMTWFEQGRLGMIAGYRSSVPALRQVPDLEFDVIAMPTVEDEATVGQITGLCISADTEDAAESADLLVDLISTASVERVVEAGYLVPANAGVALSDAFLQPGRPPEHAGVYNSSVGNLRLPPLIEDYQALEAAVAPPLQELLEAPVPDLDLLTEQVDEASRVVLSPEEPSDSASASTEE